MISTTGDSTDILTYAMVRRYLEDTDFLYYTKQIDLIREKIGYIWILIGVVLSHYLVIDCYRALDPNSFSGVWNDFS